MEGNQEFEFVSVKTEPHEDSQPTAQEFEFVSVKDEPEEEPQLLPLEFVSVKEDPEEELQLIPPDFLFVSVKEEAEGEVHLASKDEEDDNSTDPLNIDSAKKTSRKKIMKVNKQKWKKHARNSGLEYTTKQGMLIQARNMVGAPCNCPKKCFEQLGESFIQSINESFWRIGDFNKQNAYLFDFMRLEAVKRRYSKNEIKKRNYTVRYSVLKDGKRNDVCKIAFLSIHGLQQHRGRVENIQARMRSDATVPPEDKRGKHKNRPHAYSEEDVQFVRKHIEGIPKYESHYIKKNNGSKFNMLTEYSKQGCYNHYRDEFCQSIKAKPVSFDKYYRIFNEEFSILSESQKSDTCPTFDSSETDLGAKNNNGVET